MIYVVQSCDIAADSNVSNNWGFGLVVVFAVFLFSELGLTTWNLMRRMEAEGTMVCCFSLKKSRKLLRISAEVMTGSLGPHFDESWKLIMKTWWVA